MKCTSEFKKKETFYIQYIARTKKLCTLNGDHHKRLAKIKCLFTLRWLRVNVTRFQKPCKNHSFKGRASVYSLGTDKIADMSLNWLKDPSKDYFSLCE